MHGHTTQPALRAQHVASSTCRQGQLLPLLLTKEGAANQLLALPALREEMAGGASLEAPFVRMGA